MESTNFGMESFNGINGHDPNMNGDGNLSETEADAPSLNFINTALGKLNRLRNPSGASNDSNIPPLDKEIKKQC